METSHAIDALSALAHGSRLSVFKLLVQAGPPGVAAGVLSDQLDLPPATLSFHLAHLVRAGLARSRQEGRFVIYSADFESMNRLVGYLTENCCCDAGACAAPPAKLATKGKNHETLPRARRRA